MGDMSKDFQFFSYLLLITVSAHSEKIKDSQNCNPITSNGVTWPATSNRTISEPICLDQNREFQYRQCINGIWNSEPTCSFIQPDTIPTCPEGFSETDNLCYILSEKSPYPPKCPFRDVVPFNEYIHVVPITEPIWMPIQRVSVKEGYGFLQWIESSLLYKTDFDNYQVTGGSIKDKNCSVYFNESYIIVESCQMQYSAICAYRKLNQKRNQMCQDFNYCIQSDFAATSKCFCITYNNGSSYRKAEFRKIYQNHLYYFLTSDTCTIGLVKNAQGKYIWAHSNQEVDYTLWSKNVVFDEMHIYGAILQNRWILIQKETACTLYEDQLQTVEPQLELFFNESNNIITVTISHSQALKRSNDNDGSMLIFCFTDASPLSLIYRYPVLEEVITDVTYSFKPHPNGPGHYWCEAITYTTLEVIKSNTILIKQSNFGAEFVALFKLNYIHGTNPLRNDIIAFLERIFTLTLQATDNLKKFYNSRIMKILDVDEENLNVLVNVHFTSIHRNQSVSHADEYNFLKILINEVFSNLSYFNIKMMNFFSVDMCFQEETDLQCQLNGIEPTNIILVWPQTEQGRGTYSNEYCLYINGERKERICIADFDNGAHWEYVVCDCLIVEPSTQTDRLLDLLKRTKNAEDTAGTLLDLLKNHIQELNPCDILIVAGIFNSFNVKPKISVFSEIIDNLLEIDENTILEAQDIYNASDVLVEAINRILDTIEFDEIFFSSKNVAFFTFSLENVSGVLMRQTKDKTNCLTYTNPFELIYTSDSWSTRDNLESAILFDLPLSTQKFNIVLTIYCNSKLFHRSWNEEFQFESKIYALNSYSTMFANSPLKLFVNFSTSGQQFQKLCASWNKRENNWVNQIYTIDEGPFLMCQYDKASILAMTNSEIIDYKNITDNLQYILDYLENPEEIIVKLANISERYDEFSYYDIFLIGEILEKVSNDVNLDLDALAKIISNVEEVQRNILSKSQMVRSATDTILDSIDTILKNHNYSTPVTAISNNFMLAISDVTEGNFCGLVLQNINSSFQIEILTGECKTKDIAQYKNLDSAVIISPDLKNQMTVDSNIIVTIYLKDALFNEKNLQSKNVSKIFGVILPELEEYSGPISVLHNISTHGHTAKCVHWDFNKTEKIDGVWRKDTDGQNLSNLVHCPFWHTTNFALLLLDEDKYEDQLKYLDWITNITCALSLLGLIGIIITAISFKHWRINTGNQILLNFVFAIAMQITVLYSSDKIEKDSDNLICTIIGMILHYSIVSEFCWMFIIAILQFKRFVEVLGGPPKHVMVKACLCGWGLPLLPVACVWGFDPYNYNSGKVGLCYPSGLGLYLGIWLPVGIIVTINTVIFIYIMYSVIHKKTECADNGSNDIMFQWRLAILLYFMLGLSWTFGFLSEFDFGIVFVYLFCCTAPLQGFIMFLFFIVFNVNTRYLYIQSIKKWCSNKNY